LNLSQIGLLSIRKYVFFIKGNNLTEREKKMYVRYSVRSIPTFHGTVLTQHVISIYLSN